jgi:hypothetical protein
MEEAMPEFGIKREMKSGVTAAVPSSSRDRALRSRCALQGTGAPLRWRREGADEDIQRTHYHNIAKNVDRVAKATCILVILKSADLVPTQLEAHEQFSLVWMPGAEMRAWWASHNEDENYSHWIYFLDKAGARARELGYDMAN